MNMIVKSINERSELETQAFNTLIDYKYLNSCPKEAFYLSRVRVMNMVTEYKRLRACFDNYQDPKTLRRDKQIENIIKNLNKGRYLPLDKPLCL